MTIFVKNKTMTSIELNAKKAELVKTIINIDNEDILNRLETILMGLAEEKEPCIYTPEEIKAGVAEAIYEYETGKGIPHEQIKRKNLA